MQQQKNNSIEKYLSQTLKGISFCFYDRWSHFSTSKERLWFLLFDFEAEEGDKKRRSEKKMKLF